jgi:uncharacterized protein YkwD
MPNDLLSPSAPANHGRHTGLSWLQLSLIVVGLASLLAAGVILLGGSLQRGPALPVSAYRDVVTPSPSPARPSPAQTASPTVDLVQLAALLNASKATPTTVRPTPAVAHQAAVPPASRPTAVPNVIVPAPTSTPVPPPAPTAPPVVVVVPPAPSCPTASMTGLAPALFTAINNERTQRGLPALTVDGCVVFVAQYRTNDMATNNYFSHTSPDGGGAFALLDSYGVPHGWAGENLARNNYPADQAVGIAMDGLMASQAHRDNILSPNYTALGVGYAYDGVGMHYFAMVFIGPP